MPIDLVSSATAVIDQLQKFELWHAGLRGATIDPDTLTVSVLEPKPGTPPTYAILTIRRGGGITGRLLMNPASGSFLSITAVTAASASLPVFVTAAEVVGGASPGPDSAVVPALDIKLVWRHCLESASRFRPFWQLTSPGATTFVRVDGKKFSVLTPFT